MSSTAVCCGTEELAAAAVNRRGRVQSRAIDLGLDGVIVHSWRRGLAPALTGYLPGYVTNSVSLWIPADGEPVAAVRFPFERDKLARDSGLEAVVAESPAKIIPRDVRRIGLLASDDGVSELTTENASVLNGRGLEVVDLSSWWLQDTRTKTDCEMAAMTSAARVGDAALRAAGTVAAAGVTDYEIAAEVESTARRLGAYRCGCLVGFGRGEVVTEAHGATLQYGQTIGLEINMVRGGYFTHVQRTILPPGCDDTDKEAVLICSEARKLLLLNVAAGNSVANAVAAGDAVLDSYGVLAYKEYDFGHGIGWDTPEPPRLWHTNDTRFVANSVIAIHVSLRNPLGHTAFLGGPVRVGPDGATELVANGVWTTGLAGADPQFV